MARPLRLDYPGALFHITSRGVDKRATFLDDVDRVRFLEFLGEAVDRFGWIVTAYVLMTNHYHLLIQLTVPSLAKGMKWLNGRYVQRFNRRHDRVGNLFQHRYNSKLIEKEAYHLNVLRYVVLNPVRAQMVDSAGAYKWSSYRSTAGLCTAPDWLGADDVLRQFGEIRDIAQKRYSAFIDDVKARDDNPWKHLIGGVYLGTPEWLEQVQTRIDSRLRDVEHPRIQRRIRGWEIADVVRSVATALHTDVRFLQSTRSRRPRMLAAWLGTHECLLPLTTVAAGLRLGSASYISRLARECEQQLSVDDALQNDARRCLDELYAL